MLIVYSTTFQCFYLKNNNSSGTIQKGGNAVSLTFSYYIRNNYFFCKCYILYFLRIALEFSDEISIYSCVSYKTPCNPAGLSGFEGFGVRLALRRAYRVSSISLFRLFNFSGSFHKVPHKRKATTLDSYVTVRRLPGEYVIYKSG